VALNVTERLPLSRFIFERSWTPVRGTYLYPLKVLEADERPTDPTIILRSLGLSPSQEWTLPSLGVVAYLLGIEDNIPHLKP
jgi:hypothetical protein